MGRSTVTSERNHRPPHRELPPELDTPADVGRILRPVLAVFAVLVLIVIARAAAPTATPPGGPLQDASVPAQVTGGKREATKPASFGFFLPWNSAEYEAVLERVVPIGATEGIQVVDTGVLGPGEELVAFGPGYPPQGRLEPPPVEGFRIPPGTSVLDGYQLVIGVQASEPGVHSIAGFAVEYRVAGTEYRSAALQGVWLCVPREEKPACPEREEAEAGVMGGQLDIRGRLLEMVVAASR